jgi:hypothetical protein
VVEAVHHQGLIMPVLAEVREVVVGWLVQVAAARSGKGMRVGMEPAVLPTALAVEAERHRREATAQQMMEGRVVMA